MGKREIYCVRKSGREGERERYCGIERNREWERGRDTVGKRG